MKPEFKRFFQCLCLLSGVLLIGAAGAQVAPPQTGKFVVEEHSRIWRFFADQTSQEENRIVFRALSSEGAQEMTSIPLGYQEGWQTLELLDSYTLKPDGRQVPLQPDAIQKQSGALGGSTGLTWPEYRGWQLKFPDVQMRDRVVLHYKLTQLKPFLPGWSVQQWFANHNWVTEKLAIEVQAPSSMVLAIEADGVQTSRGDENGLQIHRFATRVDARTYDADARNASTTVARVLVSSVASHEQLADRFAQGMQAKMMQSAGLREIAMRQTQGLTEPAAKARALYDWVRKNIRYNAVFIGAGGWIPNNIDVILEKRYGDCKDQVLLLVNLLQAAGVEAVPALINTGTDYTLNTVAVGFNHVIVYLPELDLYLDPTGTEVPYGELPFADRGKPVVLARSQGSSLARTPGMTAAGNQIESMGDFTLDTEGTLRGVIRITAKGREAMLLQDRLARIPPAAGGGEAMRRMLEQARLTGSGSFSFAPLNRDRAEQTMEMRVEISNYLASPEAGSVAVNLALPNLPINVSSNLGNYSAEQRRFAVPCVPVTVREDFKLSFAPKFAVQRIPKAIVVEENGIRFNAKYSFDNQVLQGSREYVDTNTAMLCDVALYAKRKPVMRAITQHLRQQLTYQQ